MDRRLASRNVVLGQNEVGFSLSYSIIPLIVHKCKGEHIKDKYAYHLFMFISTFNIQENVRAVLRTMIKIS